MENITEKTPLVVQSVKEFAKSKGFTQIAPAIRVNTNGYPFITFINDKNVSENVYFSRKASMAVGAGQVITKELLSSLQIALTTNANGEERTKLISNSDRINLEDLF